MSALYSILIDRGVDVGRFRIGLDLRIPIFPGAFVSKLMALAYVSFGMRV